MGFVMIILVDPTKNKQVAHNKDGGRGCGVSLRWGRGVTISNTAAHMASLLLL